MMRNILKVPEQRNKNFVICEINVPMCESDGIVSLSSSSSFSFCSLLHCTQKHQDKRQKKEERLNLLIVVVTIQ